ncbi:uncharacterized protein LOC144712238 [Wolffia australiana]
MAGDAKRNPKKKPSASDSQKTPTKTASASEARKPPKETPSASDSQKTPTKTASASEPKKPPKDTPSASTRERRSATKKQNKASGLVSRPPTTPAVDAPDKKKKKKSKTEPDEALGSGGASRERGRKRARKSGAGAVEGAAGSEKKPTFDRIWSEEDEIKLLRALLRCRTEEGLDPASSVDLVRESLNMPFNRSQVYDKMRRLRHKWEVASAKLKSTQRAPSKPHDRLVFELSRQVWQARELPVPAEEEEPASFPGDGGHLGGVVERLARENEGLVPRGVILKGFERLHPARARELDQRWRAHCLQGINYSLQESALKSEILRACLESLDGVDL